MANSLTKSIMKNISNKLKNSDHNKNKDIKEKVVNNLRDNEEEILKSILTKNKSRSILTYSNSSNIEKNIITYEKINEKTSINDLIYNKISNQEIDKPKQKSIKKITSLRDLAK